MLGSIRGQFDQVNVYWNGDRAKFLPPWVNVMTSADDGDLTDLGKFRFLTGRGDVPQYYFTLDDDLFTRRSMPTTWSRPSTILIVSSPTTVGGCLARVAILFRPSAFQMFGGKPDR